MKTVEEQIHSKKKKKILHALNLKSFTTSEL